LTANPCEGMSAPRVVPKEVRFLNPADLPRFLSAVEKAPWPYGYLFYTFLATGLRRGEGVALNWGNLDLDAGKLRVVETLHRISGKYVLSPPKTPQSRRVIDILPSLVVLLRRYRQEVDAMGLMLGKSVSRDDFVFAHPDGRPLEPNTVTHTFSRIMRAAGIDLNLHGLRHTFASMMLAAGVNIKVISGMLGHSSVNITLDIYAHLMPGSGHQAVKLMDELLSEYLAKRENGYENPLTHVDKMLTTEGKSGARLEGFEPTTLGSEDE
jgi:integrase